MGPRLAGFAWGIRLQLRLDLVACLRNRRVRHHASLYEGRGLPTLQKSRVNGLLPHAGLD